MPDFFYVYPTYLSRSTSRALGRRVANASTVPDATIEEIAAAARALGFTATPEPDKQYPREVHSFRGRVKVAKKDGVTKATFLRRVAAEVTKRRAASGNA